MNKRRELELAVVDAAIACDRKMDEAGWTRTKLEEALHEAVLRYCLYGLAEPRFTRTVHSAPETSHEAGEWMKQFALTDACDAFRTIYFNWRHNDTGMTCEEVEEHLARSHQSMSPRINELRDAGWLVDSGERRKTRSGRSAVVWTPSAAALDLVDRVGLPIPITTTKGRP